MKWLRSFRVLVVCAVCVLFFGLSSFISCDTNPEFSSDDVEVEIEVATSDLGVLAFSDHIDVVVTAKGGDWEGS